MVNSIKLGIAFGALLGATHLSWALLVALGWAQPLMDFLFWVHFIRPVYVIQPFSFSTAAILVVITSVSGFFIAFIFGVILNWLHRYQGLE